MNHAKLEQIRNGIQKFVDVLNLDAGGVKSETNGKEFCITLMDGDLGVSLIKVRVPHPLIGKEIEMEGFRVWAMRQGGNRRDPSNAWKETLLETTSIASMLTVLDDHLHYPSVEAAIDAAQQEITPDLIKSRARDITSIHY